MRQASTALLRWTMPLMLVAALLGTAAAQNPWRGWHGPWADGVFGFRFGMDRAACRQVAQGMDLRARTARPSTLRYEGRVGGAEAGLVLEFAPGRSGDEEVLHRILLTWDGISGGGSRAVRIFERLEEALEGRYGSPKMVRRASIGDISSGYKERVRLYEGVEMQARLSLRSPGSGSLRLQLILVSPQLHPDFPR